LCLKRSVDSRRRKRGRGSFGKEPKGFGDGAVDVIFVDDDPAPLSFLADQPGLDQVLQHLPRQQSRVVDLLIDLGNLLLERLHRIRAAGEERQHLFGLLPLLQEVRLGQGGARPELVARDLLPVDGDGGLARLDEFLLGDSPTRAITASSTTPMPTSRTRVMRRSR
jgi:hypothetical protein